MKAPSQCGNLNGGAERPCGRTDSPGGAERSGEVSAGLWPDGKEGRETLRGSHINRLFHLLRCAAVCVTEVEEGRRVGE